MCRFADARRIAETSLEIARRMDDVRARGYARIGIIVLSTAIAPLPVEELGPLAEATQADAANGNDLYLSGSAMMVVAFNYLNRGLMVQSRQWSRRLLEFGRSRGDPRSTAIALWTMAWQSMLSGDFDAALHHGEEAIGVAVTQFDQVMSHVAIGTAQIATGRVAEGIVTVEKARRVAAANEWLYLLSVTDSSLGMAMVASGAIGQGIAWLEALVLRGEREYDGAVGADVGRISLAEVYVALLAGRRRPSLRVLAQNLFALVRARFIAARRAEGLLLKALGNPMFSEVGVFRARTHLALGLLHKAKGQSATAREHLERAQFAAAAQDAGAMLARIEAALASL
jgi:hypothetical protein